MYDEKPTIIFDPMVLYNKMLNFNFKLKEQKINNLNILTVIF